MSMSLCIAGCGGYARSVLETIGGMTDDLDLYFASRDVSKAREFCESFGGVGYFDSYDDAAADPMVDAMYFLTPHYMHLDNARLAAGHSKHILVEKPIARTLVEARDMIRTAEESGVKLMVAENYRFLPAVTRTKQILAHGGLGEIRLLLVENRGYERPSGWRTSLERTGGGVFIDGGIHGVDVLLNVGGFPDKVFALTTPKVHPQMEGEDGMVMMARYSSGSIGLTEYSSGTPTKESRQQVTVTCTGGVVSFDPFGVELAVRTLDGERTEALEDGRSAALRAMIREFRDCIVEDRESAMSGPEGLKDLAVVLAAYRSIELNQEVDVEQP